MLYGQKSPIIRPNQKIYRKKSSPCKNVRVIKHFQPKFIHHNQVTEQRDFPEINSDYDLIQNLETAKVVEPYSSKEASSGAPSKKILHKKPYAESNKKENNQVKNNKKFPQKTIIKTIFSPVVFPVQSNLKSKSCIEERASVHNENEVKSKSFIDMGQKTSKHTVFTSDSSSVNSYNAEISHPILLNETPLDKVKKEIIINRIEGFRSFSSCSARKDKIENLRKEISLLIKPQDSNEKVCGNLKSEAGEFWGKHENLFVYNVNDYRNNNAYEKKVRPPTPKKDMPKEQSDSSRFEERETQRSPVSPSRHAEERVTEKSTCSCHTASDDSIIQKIETANVLIKRVKETLHVIKTKTKQSPYSAFLEDTSDTEREPVSSENDEEVKIYKWKQSDDLPKEKISCSQGQNSVVLNIRRDVLEPERPKTRRQGRYDDEYVSEKFRTEPKALLDLDDQDYDLLKTKLNTISETTESDDSRASVPLQQKISKIVQVASIAINTESAVQDIKAIQVKPETVMVSTQSQFPSMDQTVQTENIEPIVEGAEQINKYQKCNRFGIQILPQINIPSSLVVQRLLNFSINQHGNTELSYRAEIPNVLFVEVTPSEVSVIDADDIDYDCKEKRPTLLNIKEGIKIFQSFDEAQIAFKNTSNLDLHNIRISPSVEKMLNRNSPGRDLELVEDRSNDNHKSTFSFTKNYKKRLCGIKTHTTTDENTPRNKQQSFTKELILRSYHVYDNKNTHDPGSLSDEPRDLISTIDDSVYRTFIDPRGIRYKLTPAISVHRSSTSNGSIEVSGSTENRQKSYRKQDRPKVYNIGLYKSKGTQYEVSSKLSTPEQKSMDEYEKISFSLTVSTDETSDTEYKTTTDESTSPKKVSYIPKPEGQAVLKQLKDRMEQKCPEKSREYDIYENLSTKVPDNRISVPDFISVLMSRPPDTLKKVIPMIRRSVKQGSSFTGEGGKDEVPIETIIAPHSEKIEQEEGSFSDLDQPISKQLPTSESAGTFIEQVDIPEQEKIVVAHEKNHSKKKIIFEQEPSSTTTIRRNQSTPETNDSSQENSEKSKDTTSIKDESKRNPDSDSSKQNKNSDEFTVMTVHVHGNTSPFGDTSKCINALEVARNGRYKDEADLFCENSYPQRPPYDSDGENYKKTSSNHKKNPIDSSNSDTITSKTPSTGEVKCHCSVSSGELHICRDPKQKTVRKKKKYAFKKKTYFNNWVTYYVTNDGLNDSSWSSYN